MTTLQTGTKLTFEEYPETPETMVRSEVLNGEVTVAGPSLYHQMISQGLHSRRR